MDEGALQKLLARYYPGFAPTRFPGADQQRYAGLVRQAIREAAESGARPVRLLDFGCGRGAVEIYDFRSGDVHVCGVDVDRAVVGNPFLDEAKLCTDELDYPDAGFDVICSAHVFEHVPDPDKTLAELRRVLKPGGRLVAMTPNAWSLPALAAKLTPQRFHAWLNAKRGRAEKDTFPTHYRLNARRDILRAARRAGFEVETLEYWEGRPEYFFFNRATFFAGLAWERTINLTPLLAGLRSSLFVVLRT